MCYYNFAWSHVLWSNKTEIKLLARNIQGTWRHVLHEIPGHFKIKSGAFVRKVKLDCHWIFQQDNDPKHMYKSIQKWFTDHRIKFLHWPYHVTDMNLNENLWVELWRESAQQRTSDPRWSAEILSREIVSVDLYSETL